MGRRYLRIEEADKALRSGKAVECFIGACALEDKAGIRWISIRTRNDGVVLQVFETADVGNEDYVDVYEFGPLNGDFEFDEAQEEFHFSDFPSCVAFLTNRYLGSTSRFVNEGVLQDEYSDYIARGRKNV